MVAGMRWLGGRKGTSPMTKRCCVAVSMLNQDECSPTTSLPPAERDQMPDMGKKKSNDA